MRISTRIESDLKAKILADEKIPQQITLEGLAEEYGVSLTPVRIAVRSLIEEKYVLKQPNGRLQINPELRGSGGQLATRQAIPEEENWYEKLADEVIRLSFRGVESYLREEAIAAERGVGRSVVRHIFSRLVGAGLLDHVPRRGWRVRPLRQEEVKAYLEVREVLEVKALELALPRLDEPPLLVMLAGNLEGPPGATGLNNDLHKYLIARSGNSYIQEFFARHGGFFTTLFEYAAPTAEMKVEMARQHREIITALLAKDWNRAKEVLVEHIRTQEPSINKAMQLLRTPPAATPATS